MGFVIELKTMFLLLTVFVLTAGTCTNEDSLQKHPPVWQYNYQFELFEKILQETADLKRELKEISARVLGIENDCPTFWVQGNGSCYHLQLGYAADWYHAKTSCEQIGSHLLVLGSQEEGNLLREILESGKVGEDMLPMWIGGYKPEYSSDWKWVEDSELEDVPVTREERHRHKEHLCLSWNLKNLKFNNTCKRKFRFICEKKIVKTN